VQVKGEPEGEEFASSSCFRLCMRAGLLHMHLPGELSILQQHSYKSTSG